MLLEPALASQAQVLDGSEFSSPLLGRVYTLLRHRLQEGLSPQLAALAGDLTDQEMSHMVRVLDQPEDLSNSRQAMADYIQIVQTEALKRSGGDDPAQELLLAARDKFREKKSYGG